MGLFSVVVSVFFTLLFVPPQAVRAAFKVKERNSSTVLEFMVVNWVYSFVCWLGLLNKLIMLMPVINIKIKEIPMNNI